MAFIEKSKDEIQAMSPEDFMLYLAEAAAEDANPGGARDQKRAFAKANPPKPPQGPVEAIVVFPASGSAGSGHSE